MNEKTLKNIEKAMENISKELLGWIDSESVCCSRLDTVIKYSKVLKILNSTLPEPVSDPFEQINR